MPQLVFERFVQIVRSVLGRAPVRTIVEVGARDCVETLDFESTFPEARIFAFECNPATLPACRLAVMGRDRIKLVEKAVSDQRGTVTFYPTDPERTVTKHANGNPGASSLFRASPDYPHETYVQNEITVETTTLDDFMRSEGITGIDLLWMDIQGAELLALKGLGDRLRDVGLIHMEVEFLPIYQGQPLFDDVHEYLRAHGFTLLGFTSYSRYSGDAVYASPRRAGILDALTLRLKYPYLVRTRLDRLRHRIKRVLLRRNPAPRP